jgi:5-methylcytosine-specific restriction protein B
MKARSGDIAELEMISPKSYRLRVVRIEQPRLSETPKVDTPQTIDTPSNAQETSVLPTNVILYGPPGTGKTYSVVLKAMSIVDANDYGLAVSPEVYQNLKQRYDALVRDGQIAFVTFHQSYGYEDFIEGIRPKTEGGQISYDIRDGILKVIALTARDNWQKAKGADKETLDDDALFERIWEDLAESFDENLNAKVKVKLFRGGEAELEQGQVGKNLLVSMPGYKNTYSLSKKQLKRLWGRRQEITRPSDTKLYNGSLFWGVLEHLKGLAAAVQPVAIQMEELKPFVLVIDEINRGNISKIFGELITLVESDKRLGEPFEMTVTLPYSQGDEEPFGLPPNLHLVGTMNTSDRSIALLDTALRRRFEFEEIQPNPNVLKGLQLDVDVDLSALLSAINERVEYLYDRDHTIGHAYFVGVKTLADLERVFRRKVIPLLQEYFYEDWSKVVLVLNDSAGRFIERDVRVPRGLTGLDMDIEPKPRFRVCDGPFVADAFQNIYRGQ